jgi:cbb3-type cytochrome oxidase maturation protein
MMLVVISLGAGLAAFVWGVRSGQFANQDRARYLPLADGLPPRPILSSSRSGAQYGMMAVLIIGAIVLMAPIVMILYRLRG